MGTRSSWNPPPRPSSPPPLRRPCRPPDSGPADARCSSRSARPPPSDWVRRSRRWGGEGCPAGMRADRVRNASQQGREKRRTGGRARDATNVCVHPERIKISACEHGRKSLDGLQRSSEVDGGVETEREEGGDLRGVGAEGEGLATGNESINQSFAAREDIARREIR